MSDFPDSIEEANAKLNAMLDRQGMLNRKGRHEMTRYVVCNGNVESAVLLDATDAEEAARIAASAWSSRKGATVFVFEQSAGTKYVIGAPTVKVAPG
jgi:hypothetical protein